METVGVEFVGTHHHAGRGSQWAGTVCSMCISSSHSRWRHNAMSAAAGSDAGTIRLQSRRQAIPDAFDWTFAWRGVTSVPVTAAAAASMPAWPGLLRPSQSLLGSRDDSSQLNLNSYFPLTNPPCSSPTILMYISYMCACALLSFTLLSPMFNVSFRYSHLPPSPL